MCVIQMCEYDGTIYVAGLLELGGKLKGQKIFYGRFHWGIRPPKKQKKTEGKKYFSKGSPFGFS